MATRNSTTSAGAIPTECSRIRIGDRIESLKRLPPVRLNASVGPTTAASLQQCQHPVGRDRIRTSRLQEPCSTMANVVKRFFEFEFGLRLSQATTIGCSQTVLSSSSSPDFELSTVVCGIGLSK